MDAEAVAPEVVRDRDGLLARTGSSAPLRQGGARSPTSSRYSARTVIEDGGEVRHIERETDLRNDLTGALLRFELPPRPGDPE